MAGFRWSLREISALLQRRELSPTDIVRATASAVVDAEPGIQAWCHLCLGAAMQSAEEQAEELKNRPPRSALCGATYGAKDIFDAAGQPTEWGSSTQKGRVPRHDSELVAQLNSLGCILAGKTHTTAYAYYDTGPTRNPHEGEHTPGGSSSGSAAAVAAGMVPLAIGTQTQGSVLRPASYCGVVGFKPSYGRLPLAGVMPFAPSLDHAGLFAASAADVEFAWQALASDPAAEAPEDIAVIDWPPEGRLEPAMAQCFRAAIQTLAGGGARVQSVPRPEFFDALPAALHSVMAYEAAREHGKRYREHGAAMGAKLAELLEEGLQIDEEAYAGARQTLRAAQAAHRQWSRDHPVVATPAALGPAPQGLGSSGDPRCNAPFTALGAPAISIPMPTAEGQLPLGLQLAAAPGSDSMLLAAACACEKDLGVGP